jgi:hypothetical protein
MKKEDGVQSTHHDDVPISSPLLLLILEHIRPGLFPACEMK